MLKSDVGELLVSLSSVLFICLLVLVEASDYINTENLWLCLSCIESQLDDKYYKVEG
jgi:hypothetical protein